MESDHTDFGEHDYFFHRFNFLEGYSDNTFADYIDHLEGKYTKRQRRVKKYKKHKYKIDDWLNTLAYIQGLKEVVK